MGDMEKSDIFYLRKYLRYRVSCGSQIMEVGGAAQHGMVELYSRLNGGRLMEIKTYTYHIYIYICIVGSKYLKTALVGFQHVTTARRTNISRGVL